ncbi:MAG: HAD family phosphatase [Roseburia sp.]|nr:HAD family phosphatase [Roseburia sp.]
MIKNIVLDVGRVLVAWQPKQKWREWGFSDEIVAEFSEKLFDSGVWNEADRGVLSDDEFYALAAKQVPQYEKELRYFWEYIDEAIWQLPYAREWIRGMKDAGYQVYILSNYGNWTYEKTREKALNFLDDVDGAIFSYQVKQIKPNPDIFQTLFEKFSLKPEECVFLDDLPANIEGAKEAGMHGIVFTELEDALSELEKMGVEIKM